VRVGLVETELANVRSNDFIASVVPKGQTERCTVENDQHGEEAAEIEESLFVSGTRCIRFHLLLSETLLPSSREQPSRHSRRLANNRCNLDLISSSQKII